MQHQKTTWDWEFTSRTSWLGSSLSELLKYRDLLFQMVRRNFILYYQQTLLGPLWMLISPLLTVLVYMLIFSRVMKVPTEGMPPFVFFLSGVTLWTLFTDVLTGTSNILTANANLFNKVYFPRLVIPFSTTILHLLRFTIQLGILLLVLVYYHFSGELNISLFRISLIVPVILSMTSIALGAGLLFSIVTAKYKDISNIIGLMTRLLMFICPVFYPVAIIPQDLRFIVYINPLTTLFENFRFALTGTGYASTDLLLLSMLISFLVLLGGLLFFNKMSDKLLDVV